MILQLRQRHRHLVLALGIFLPAALVMGIALRKPVPSMERLPDALIVAPQKFATAVWERGDLFVKSPIQVRLLRRPASPGQFAIELSAPPDFIKPDLIVYWGPEDSKITDTIPANSQLLGAFQSSLALTLPDDSAPKTGVIVLYSLADNEVVEVSKPFSISQP